jgi:hypothetical protein
VGAPSTTPAAPPTLFEFPTATAPGTLTDTGSSSDDDPAWYDIPGQIRKGIADFFLWVAKSGLQPVMDLLGATVLSTPDLVGNPAVQAVWGTCLLVANTCFVLFVVAAGFVLTTRETLQSRYGLKELLPRLMVGGLAANVSLIICGKAIEATNALTAAIVGPGVDGPTAAAALAHTMIGAGTSPIGGPIGGLLLALLILAALAMAIVIVIMFFLRLALLIILVGVAPLGLACHALPQTEGLAYLWWRSFIAVLGIQLGQAVLLLATIKVFLTPTGITVLGAPATTSGWTSVCVSIAMLWLMIKLPGLMKRFVLGPARGRGLLGQVVGTVIAIKTLGAAAGVTSSSTRNATGSRRGAGPAGGSRPGGARPRPGGPAGPNGGRRPGRPPGPRPGGGPTTGHPGARNVGPVWRSEPDTPRAVAEPAPPTPPAARARPAGEIARAATPAARSSRPTPAASPLARPAEPRRQPQSALPPPAQPPRSIPPAARPSTPPRPVGSPTSVAPRAARPPGSTPPSPRRAVPPAPTHERNSSR